MSSYGKEKGTFKKHMCMVHYIYVYEVYIYWKLVGCRQRCARTTLCRDLWEQQLRLGRSGWCSSSFGMVSRYHLVFIIESWGCQRSCLSSFIVEFLLRIGWLMTFLLRFVRFLQHEIDYDPFVFNSSIVFLSWGLGHLYIHNWGTIGNSHQLHTLLFIFLHYLEACMKVLLYL